MSATTPPATFPVPEEHLRLIAAGDLCVRFAHYLRCTGRPIEHEQKHVAGYIHWVQRRWAEWLKVAGKSQKHYRTPKDHREFDRWLATLPAVESKDRVA